MIRRLTLLLLLELLVDSIYRMINSVTQNATTGVITTNGGNSGMKLKQ